MNPTLTRAPFLVTLCAALAVPFPAMASTALNCFGTASGKTAVQVHAILDCALDDGSFAWCDINVKIDDRWLDLPNTLRSTTRPDVFPEAPDDLVGTRTLKPPITVLRVLDERKKLILELTLHAVAASDAAVVFMGRTNVSWKGHRFKDLAVTCDEPG